MTMSKLEVFFQPICYYASLSKGIKKALAFGEPDKIIRRLTGFFFDIIQIGLKRHV